VRPVFLLDSCGTPVKLPGVVTYTITTSPTKGAVLVNLNLGLVSTVVYTANNLLFPAHDSFVVTVTDGHGGTNVQTLNPF
jgi:hypothetical protein